MGRVKQLLVPCEQPPQWSATACGGGAAAPAPSLDSRTLIDSGPGWKVTLFDFGGGLVEATAVFSDRRRHLVTARSNDVELVERLERERARERVMRSVRRAKQSCRRRIYALCPDRMLTLTKRGKFPDVDSAWAAWSRFERICSRFWRNNWKYVVVPERHADGTYHLHVALVGFYHVGMLRRFWFRALGGTGHESGESTPGNVDMSWHRAGSRSRIRIARYLRKYMGKDLASCVRGRRSFAASRGLTPIRIARWHEPVHLGLAAVLVVQRRVCALVGNVTLDSFEWSEAGIQGFTVKTAGS